MYGYTVVSLSSAACIVWMVEDGLQDLARSSLDSKGEVDRIVPMLGLSLRSQPVPSCRNLFGYMLAWKPLRRDNPVPRIRVDAHELNIPRVNLFGISIAAKNMFRGCLPRYQGH
jgi:hypothetical protein